MGEYSIRTSATVNNDTLDGVHNTGLYSDARAGRGHANALILKHEQNEDIGYPSMYVDSMMPWSTSQSCCTYLPCLEDTVVASADGMLGYHDPCSVTTTVESGTNCSHSQSWEYSMPLPLVGNLPPYCEGPAVTPTGSQGHSGSMVALLAASVATNSLSNKMPRQPSFATDGVGLSSSTSSPSSSLSSSPAKDSADATHLPATPPTSPSRETLSVSSTPSLSTLSSPGSPKRRAKSTRMIHPCQYSGCHKVFSRPYNLKSHMRTHSTERPYVCHFAGCNWKFARPHDLKRHTLLHTGQKPHGCPYCDRRFGRSDALRRHWKASPMCAEAREQSMATARNR